MYIAMRTLNVGGRQIKSGEPVPDAEGWQYSVIQAHLNLGWIEKREDPTEAMVTQSEFVPQESSVTTQEPDPKKGKKNKKKGA